jgi:multiple sugar transport system permease protein
VTISMTVSVLAGYSLSRFRVRGGQTLGLFILTAKMLPATLLVIPLFGIFRTVDLIGSLWSIIFAHATLIIPFTTWMLKGYFDTIPQELEQAAMVDGCSPVGALVRVILPVASPPCAANTSPTGATSRPRRSWSRCRSSSSTSSSNATSSAA